MKQKVIILVGASGTGKTTLAEHMVEKGIAVKAITSTSRDMRAGEVDGVHYNFKSKEDLMNDYKNGELLEEPNEFAGNLYAASKSGLIQNDGKPVVLILDPNGANTVYEKLKKDPSFEPSVVFLKPIPKDVVVERIRARGSSDEELEKRMQVFDDESKWYDKIEKIINLALEQDTKSDVDKNINNYINRIKAVLLSDKKKPNTIRKFK